MNDLEYRTQFPAYYARDLYLELQMIEERGIRLREARRRRFAAFFHPDRKYLSRAAKTA